MFWAAGAKWDTQDVISPPAHPCTATWWIYALLIPVRSCLILSPASYQGCDISDHFVPVRQDFSASRNTLSHHASHVTSALPPDANLRKTCPRVSSHALPVSAPHIYRRPRRGGCFGALTANVCVICHCQQAPATVAATRIWRGCCTLASPVDTRAVEKVSFLVLPYVCLYDMFSNAPADTSSVWIDS